MRKTSSQSLRNLPVAAASKPLPEGDGIDTSALEVVCAWTDYSASRIARAVEDCDAQLLGLDVSARGDGCLVRLRVNVRNPLPVVRSLARYGYDVSDVGGSAGAENGMDEILASRMLELRRYLEI